MKHLFIMLMMGAVCLSAQDYTVIRYHQPNIVEAVGRTAVGLTAAVGQTAIGLTCDVGRAATDLVVGRDTTVIVPNQVVTPAPVMVPAPPVIYQRPAEPWDYRYGTPVIVAPPRVHYVTPVYRGYGVPAVRGGCGGVYYCY